MAAPAFGSIGTQLQGSASTMNVPAPSGVAVGDILVVAAYINGAGTTVSAMPSGWAHAPDSPVGGPDNHSMAIMWKRADSGDTGASTFDFTLSVSEYRNAACTRYTGAIASGDPWDVTNSAGSNSLDTNSPAVSDTTTVADTLLIWSSTNWLGGAWTPPTSFTERRDSGDQVCTSADLVQAAAGATGSIVGSCAGSNKRTAWLGALEPISVTADTSAYTPARLPGRIGPDGRVFVTGARYDDTAAAATQAPGGDAEGTGSAFPVTAALGITPGTATAAGSALQATVTTSAGTNAPAGLASASGTAFAPTIAIAALPGVPTAAGAAHQPAVAERVNAGTTTAAGSAPQSTAAVRPNAGAASGTGAALQASTAIRVNAGTATASGAAGQATVSISGSINAPAGVASAIGAALSPQVAVAPVAATPTATGIAFAGRLTLTVLPGTATAGGIAFGVAGPIQPVTPYTRTFYVPSDPRELEVPAENRTFAVPADARTFVIPGDEEA